MQIKCTNDGPAVACSVTAFRHCNIHCRLAMFASLYSDAALYCCCIQDMWQQQLYVHGNTLLPGHMLCAAISVLFSSLYTDLLCALLHQLALTTRGIASICVASCENTTGLRACGTAQVACSSNLLYRNAEHLTKQCPDAPQAHFVSCHCQVTHVGIWQEFCAG